MKTRVFAVLFLCVFCFQCMGPLLVYSVFKLNREAISQSMCENRYRPLTVCKGSCVLVKALKKTENSGKTSRTIVSFGFEVFSAAGQQSLPEPLILGHSRTFPLVFPKKTSEAMLHALLRPPVV